MMTKYSRMDPPDHIRLPELWENRLPRIIPEYYRTAITAICDAIALLVGKLNQDTERTSHRKAFFFDPTDPNTLKSLPNIARKIKKLLSEVNRAIACCQFHGGDLEVPVHLKEELEKKPIVSCIVRNYRKVMAMPYEKRLEYLVSRLDDIIRCRILCTYLADLRKLNSRLTDELPSLLNSKLEGRPRFRLLKRKKESLYEEGPPFKSAGHRAVHRHVKVTAGRKSFTAEIQLMTLLQGVWDRMEHPIYELRRTMEKKKIHLGEVPFNMRALSDLLVVADYFASGTWNLVSSESRKPRRRLTRPALTEDVFKTVRRGLHG